MWKLKKINDIDYFLNIQIQQAGLLLKFNLTNFCKLWCAEMSKQQIVDQCKNINEWLEADDETLLSESLNLFDVSRTDVIWSLNSNRLDLESDFGGMSFSFHVDLQLADTENFSELIVSPLLLIIKNLQQQKEYLKTCLRRKDTEIAEYKLDGAVISRKNIETPVFHESLIPNMFNEESRKLTLSKPSDLIDDQIISSYNEIYSVVSSETADTNAPRKNEVASDEKGEEKSHQVNKIPKNSSDLVVQVEGRNNILASSVPIPEPIRKKPQPRKLKNL